MTKTTAIELNVLSLEQVSELFEKAFSENNMEMFDELLSMVTSNAKYGFLGCLACQYNNTPMALKLIPKLNTKYVEKYVLLVAAERGNLEVIDEILSLIKRPKDVENSFYLAARNGHFYAVEKLLPYANRQHCNNALQAAAQNGHRDIVKLLIPASDPKTDNSCALQFAAENGHIEIVKLLIPVSNARDDASSAILYAAVNGHLEIVQLLCPISDVTENDCAPFKAAAHSNHIDIVRFLIEHTQTNPSINDCKALRQAIAHKHNDLAKLLWSVSDIENNRYELLHVSLASGNVHFVSCLLPVCDFKSDKMLDTYQFLYAAIDGHSTECFDCMWKELSTSETIQDWVEKCISKAYKKKNFYALTKLLPVATFDHYLLRKMVKQVAIRLQDQESAEECSEEQEDSNVFSRLILKEVYTYIDTYTMIDELQKSRHSSEKKAALLLESFVSDQQKQHLLSEIGIGSNQETVKRKI